MERNSHYQQWWCRCDRCWPHCCSGLEKRKIDCWYYHNFRQVLTKLQKAKWDQTWIYMNEDMSKFVVYPSNGIENTPTHDRQWNQIQIETKKTSTLPQDVVKNTPVFPQGVMEQNDEAMIFSCDNTGGWLFMKGRRDLSGPSLQQRSSLIFLMSGSFAAPCWERQTLAEALLHVLTPWKPHSGAVSPSFLPPVFVLLFVCFVAPSAPHAGH